MGADNYDAMEFIISISFMKSGLAYRLSAGTNPDSVGANVAGMANIF